MKQICPLLIFSLISSVELNAQGDHSKISGKDSITATPLDVIQLDSNYRPPCILPLEHEDKNPVLTYNFASFDSGCHAKGAKKDLKNGKAIIWFPGGIFGLDFSSKADQEFQNRYQVRFVSPGCCRFGDENPEAYNEVIFEYLDKKYGTGWRDELRRDAKGFIPPKTSNVASSLQLSHPMILQIRNSGKKAAYALSSANVDPGTLVWWYVLPTSGFALLLSFYLIIKRRKKD